MKFRLLQLGMIFFVLRMNGLVAQTFVDGSTPRKWHVEVGLNVRNIHPRGEMVNYMQDATREYNAFSMMGDPTVVYQNNLRICPQVQGTLRRDLSNHFFASVGLGYCYWLMHERQTWNFPNGSFANPLVEWWMVENRLRMHVASFPLSFGWKTFSSKHRLSAQLIPNLFITGNNHYWQKSKHQGQSPQVFFPARVRAMSVPVVGTAWNGFQYYGYFQGISRINLGMALRYEYGLRLLKQKTYLGFAFEYSLTPVQYQSEVHYAVIGWWTPPRPSHEYTVGYFAVNAGIAVELK